MNEKDREGNLEEFERIREACKLAPGPKEGDFPEWNGGTFESLPEFFNNTAHLWDEKFGDSYSDLHAATAVQIPQTDAAITVLDVGCGTGLEFEYIFERATNVHITGLDQAPRMLDQVRQKYRERINQITLIESSCLELPDSLAEFDFAVSILTVHHFPPDVKQMIYGRIRSTLKESGTYIEGDQSASSEQEVDNLYQFNAWIAKLPGGSQGSWNYDVTLSVDTNTRLLREAGFNRCEMTWEKRNKRGNGHAVLVGLNG